MGLHDPLIRFDTEIPADGVVEFRAIMSTEVKVIDYLDDGERTITIQELRRRIANNEHGSDQDVYHGLKDDGEFELIEMLDYAAVDLPEHTQRPRFEFKWEREERERQEREPRVLDHEGEPRPPIGGSLAALVRPERYVKPWGAR
jgi:hypothetical protein